MLAPPEVPSVGTSFMKRWCIHWGSLKPKPSILKFFEDRAATRDICCGNCGVSQKKVNKVKMMSQTARPIIVGGVKPSYRLLSSSFAFFPFRFSVCCFLPCFSHCAFWFVSSQLSLRVSIRVFDCSLHLSFCFFCSWFRRDFDVVSPVHAEWKQAEL